MQTRNDDQAAGLGESFARALAAKDSETLLRLLHPQIDFRGLTPNRFWEASEAEEVLSGVLWQWFETSDRIEALEQLETGTLVDRERVGYRLRVRNEEGQWLVEQQAYLSERDGRIGWMRVLCSGMRPA